MGGWPYAVRRVEGRQDTRVQPLGRSPASGSAVRSGKWATACDYGGLHAAAQAVGDQNAPARGGPRRRAALWHRDRRWKKAGLLPPAEGDSKGGVHCRGRPGRRRVDRLRDDHHLWLDRRICIADRGVVRRHSGDATARCVGALCAKRIVRPGWRRRDPRMADPLGGRAVKDRKVESPAERGAKLGWPSSSAPSFSHFSS